MNQVVLNKLNNAQSKVNNKRSSMPDPSAMFNSIYKEKIGSVPSVNKGALESQGNNSSKDMELKQVYEDFIKNYLLNNNNNSSGSPAEYEQYIQEACKLYGVDPALVKAVIECESSFNPNAVSSAGAVGLMQLMPATAKGLGVNNSYDPRQNIHGGVKYLADLIKNFKGDLRLALSGYNMGGNAVKNKGITPNTMNFSEYYKLPSGVLGYANKVLNSMSKY